MRGYKINKYFGKKVKKYRNLAVPKISQEELAELVNLSRNHIGRIERGEVNVSLPMIQKIAKALKVKSIDLMSF